MTNDRNGFARLEIVLLLVIAAIIGFTGWYVWQSKNKADNTLNQAGQINNLQSNSAAVKSYDDCAKAAGSKMLTTYPGICVSANGQRFVQPLGQNTPQAPR